MDEMKITSKFTTGIISRIVNSVIKKKLGFNVCTCINSVSVSVENGKSKIHIDADASIEQDELTRILKQYGF